MNGALYSLFSYLGGVETASLSGDIGLIQVNNVQSDLIKINDLMKTYGIGGCIIWLRRV